jgi:hypothetical protein
MERKLVVDWVPSCDLEDSAGKEVSLLFGMKSISSMELLLILLRYFFLCRPLKPTKKHGSY